MATTAERCGYGARAPWAELRESEHGMKERVRLSGLFLRVRDKPLSNELQEPIKEFEQNAALGCFGAAPRIGRSVAIRPVSP